MFHLSSLLTNVETKQQKFPTESFASMKIYFSHSFTIGLLGTEVRWLIGRHKIVSTRLAIGLPIFGIDEPVSIRLYPSRWPQIKVIVLLLTGVSSQLTHLGHNCRVRIKHPKTNELLLTHMRSGLNQAIQFYNNLSSDEQEDR